MAICKINKSMCIGCGLCKEACVNQAIFMDKDGKAEVNQAVCKGCKVCTRACPTGACKVEK